MNLSPVANLIRAARRLPESLQNARIMDVGVDATVKLTGSYRLMAWEEVKEALSSKGSVSVDGHKVKSNEH